MRLQQGVGGTLDNGGFFTSDEPVVQEMKGKGMNAKSNE